MKTAIRYTALSFIVLYAFSRLLILAIPGIANHFLAQNHLASLEVHPESIFLNRATLLNLNWAGPVRVQCDSLELGYSLKQLLFKKQLESIHIHQLQIEPGTSSAANSPPDSQEKLKFQDLFFDHFLIDRLSWIFPGPVFSESLNLNLELKKIGPSALGIQLKWLQPSPSISLEGILNLETLSLKGTVSFDCTKYLNSPVPIRGTIRFSVRTDPSLKNIYFEGIEGTMESIPEAFLKGEIHLEKKEGRYCFDEAGSRLFLDYGALLAHGLTTGHPLLSHLESVSPLLLTWKGSLEDFKIGGEIPVQDLIVQENMHVDGKLSFEIHWNNQRSPNALLKIRLTDAQIQRADLFHIEGIDSRIELDLQNLRSASLVQKLQIRKVSYPPFQFENLHCDFRIIDWNEVLFESLNGEWCGGKLSTHAFYFGLSPLKLETELFFDHVKANELLTLFPQKKTRASGEFYGRIPIDFQQGKITLKDGFLYTTPGGGRIESETFLLSDLARDKPEIQKKLLIADEALRDFEFEKIQFNLSGSGEHMQLLYQIKGKSRKKNLPPLDLSVTIEGQLDALINQLMKVKGKLSLG